MRRFVAVRGDGPLDRGALGRAVLRDCPFAFLPPAARVAIFGAGSWALRVMPDHLTLAQAGAAIAREACHCSTERDSTCEVHGGAL